MRKLRFGEAIEDALMQAMATDEKIIIMGEDVHGLRMNLRVRFGRRPCAADTNQRSGISWSSSERSNGWSAPGS